MGYENIPQFIGVAVSSGKATLYELQTVYSVSDLSYLIEVIQIDNYNESLAKKGDGNGSRQVSFTAKG